jgi:hypothetical protein
VAQRQVQQLRATLTKQRREYEEFVATLSAE